MAVCRIEKTKDYTVMANHHLRNKELSLKAKGLLSLMLSLPGDWDYTVKGLAYICKDGIDSINGAIKELEITGYMSRQRIRNDRGQLTNTEYTIREYPKADTPTEGELKQESPIWENPTQADPVQEEPHQLNTYLLTTQEPKKDLSITEPSNPYQSNPCQRGKSRCDGIGYDAYEEIKEMVFENIEYEHLCKHGGIGMRERLDEVADIIIETLCSTKETINIAGEDYPARLVKDKMLKINSTHIEYVFDCLNKNTTYVRNIKRYLLATLFNAPSTIDSYYAALVNHDLYSPNR